MIRRYTNSVSQRAVRTRAKIANSGRPRLTVFRSNKFIYAQVIDDAKHVTLAHSFGKNPKEVGEKIAQKAKEAKIDKIVFDRGRYNYHGQVKLLAEAARAGGLQF
jgi:large subunit ribosomal protein L18